MSVNNPPVDRPISSATLDLASKSVSLDRLDPAWQKWFSDLLIAVNEGQATGTTAERPDPPPFIGFMFFDTTLGYPIWAKTTTEWVDAVGITA